MNSRCYHRNSLLAFPRTTAYACAIEGPRPRPILGWLYRLLKGNQ